MGNSVFGHPVIKLFTPMPFSKFEMVTAVSSEAELLTEVS